MGGELVELAASLCRDAPKPNRPATRLRGWVAARGGDSQKRCGAVATHQKCQPRVFGDLIQSVHDVPVLADAVVVVGGGYELCR